MMSPGYHRTHYPQLDIEVSHHITPKCAENKAMRMRGYKFSSILLDPAVWFPYKDEWAEVAVGLLSRLPVLLLLLLAAA
jgi:hypothetical protein